MNTSTELDPRVWLTVDAVVAARHGGQWCVLLIERRWNPYQWRQALPGGHVNKGESLESAVIRELWEETGVEITDVTQIGAYGDPGRDPRGRYLSVAFLAVLDELAVPRAGDDADTAYWLQMPIALVDARKLAFDHHRILTDAARLLGDPKEAQS